MRFDELDAAIAAIRATGGDDPDRADATQLRVRRSLERRARGRHQLVGLVTTVAILFAGTVSWALATGHVAALWTPVHEPAPAEPATREPAEPPPTRSASRARVSMAIPPVPPLPPETVTPPAPVVSIPLPLPRPLDERRDASALSPQRRRPAPPLETLYRTAHELHFRGGDPAAALRAWDAYLAAEPGGRFSVEARYNRALTLLRLQRYAEARAALLPFAHGTVEPSGYRQHEAEQLVERLAHSALNEHPRSGDSPP